MGEAGAQKRRSNILVVILAVIGALTLTAAVLFISTLFWGLSTFSNQIILGSSRGLSQMKSNFIAEIKLEGPIGSELIDEVIEKIDSVEKSDQARAIFLEVNSPGGTVVASQELHDRILEVRKKIPVLSYYRDVAASGAYYGSSASTWLVANRGSMVGSIGVIMQSVVIKDLLDWAHLKPITIKSGSLKDAGSQVRELNAEDETYLTALLKNTHAQFIDDVLKGRNVSERQKDLLTALQSLKINFTEEALHADLISLKDLPVSSMDHMRDGRVVLGDEAVRMGLADIIGSKQKAVEVLRKILQDPEIELETIEDEENFDSIIEHYLERVQISFQKMVREILFTQATGAPELQAR